MTGTALSYQDLERRVTALETRMFSAESKIESGAADAPSSNAGGSGVANSSAPTSSAAPVSAQDAPVDFRREPCAICGSCGADRRTLRVGFFYDLTELSTKFKLADKALYSLRACKRCRGDFLERLGRWCAGEFISGEDDDAADEPVAAPPVPAPVSARDGALPERPGALDHEWTTAVFADARPSEVIEDAEEERRYCIALESRLAAVEAENAKLHCRLEAARQSDFQDDLNACLRDHGCPVGAKIVPWLHDRLRECAAAESEVARLTALLSGRTMSCESCNANAAEVARLRGQVAFVDEGAQEIAALLATSEAKRRDAEQERDAAQRDLAAARAELEQKQNELTSALDCAERSDRIAQRVMRYYVPRAAALRALETVNGWRFEPERLSSLLDECSAESRAPATPPPEIAPPTLDALLARIDSEKIGCEVYHSAGELLWHVVVAKGGAELRDECWFNNLERTLARLLDEVAGKETHGG